MIRRALDALAWRRARRWRLAAARRTHHTRTAA